MNAPVQNSNRKAELLSRTVEHVAIDQYDARPVIDAMRQMSFTSRDTARAADIFSMALEDKGCSTWLTLAGSTSAGGCMCGAGSEALSASEAMRMIMGRSGRAMIRSRRMISSMRPTTSR